MTSPHLLGGLAAALVASPLTPYVAACSQQADRRLDTSAPISYFVGVGAAGPVATGQAVPGFQEGDRALAEWALRAWAGLGGRTVELVPGPEATAILRIYFLPAGAGLYGEMRGREVDGRPAADVFVHPDTDALGADIARMARSDPLFRDTVVFLTCVHELGHAFGLTHTSAFADIMYSFQYGGDFVGYFRRFREKLGVRDDFRRASPFSAGDTEAFARLYP